MRAFSDWNEIQASNGGSSLLEMGGYVCKIIRINDFTSEEKPYIQVIFDPYIKEQKRYVFGAEVDEDPEQDWKHNFRFYFNNPYGRRLYKKFVECIEASNNGFIYSNTDGAEQTLVGKWCGILINHRIYTKNDGGEATVLDYGGAYTIDQIQNGDYPEPKVRDTRKGSDGSAAQAKPTDLYDEDIPF